MRITTSYLQFYLFLLWMLIFFSIRTVSLEFTRSQIVYYREKVKSMFYHAYNGYLKYAYPLDELKPITCSGMNTWGSFSLTLIDALDTLLIMGNETEFIRAVNIIMQSVKADANVNVSVFETNIRVVGGLLTAHLLSGRVKGMILEPGWPCSGPLLRLAERFAQKLLPAFNTYTGMPYGTVNLRYGVHHHETPVTCTACVGTFILEFGALSRLTGNPHYERVALKALSALWNSRSELGLVGNHINVQTGEWTATDAGIGAGIDSYFEYLAKGALLFQRPLLMYQFNQYVKAVNKHVRKGDWFVWVSMTKAQVTLPIYQSLESFWPGVLALLGNVDDAQRILLQYAEVVRQYGFPPEFYNLPKQEAVKNRSGYPLRPEFIESVYYLYKATEDPLLLQLAATVVEAIEHSCRTACGFSTIENVMDHTVEDRMESFFLSETSKYLYLIFDESNFMNNDGTRSRVVETPNGPCIVDAGGYIFNTEAHPLDPGALYCCSAKKNNDVRMLKRFEDEIDFTKLIDISDPFLYKTERFHTTESDLPLETRQLDERKEGSQSKNYMHYQKVSEANDSLEEEEEAEEEDDGTAQEVAKIVDDFDPVVPSADRHEEMGGAPNISFGAEASQQVSEKNDAETVAKDSQRSEGISDQIRELISQAEALKKKEVAKDPSRRKLVSEFVEALRSVKEELAAVVDASNWLEGMSADMAMRLKLESGKGTESISLMEAPCESCCRPLDYKGYSVALRRMLSVIYGRHIYPKAGIQSIIGPICSLNEGPTPEDVYSNDIPGASDVDETQILDAITDIRLGSFRYRSLASEQYELLSSPPLSFLSQFTGLGQVKPLNDSETSS